MTWLLWLLVGTLAAMALIGYITLNHTQWMAAATQSLKKMGKAPAVAAFAVGFFFLYWSHQSDTVQLRGVRYTGAYHQSTLMRCLTLLGDYEPSLAELLLQECRPKDTVVDIGANEGYFSVLLAPRVAKVYAVEPDPTNVQLLRRNLELNGATNVTVLPMAASSSDSELTMATCNFNRMWNMVTPPTLKHKIQCLGTGTADVQVKRLDGVVDGVPDVVKMDVEGHETEVLKGVPQWIGKTRLWVIETDNPAVVDQFRQAGYSAQWLHVDSIAATGAQRPQPLPADGHLGFWNIVFTKADAR